MRLPHLEIAQGYAGSDKLFLNHDVASLRPTSIRLILSFSSMLRFMVFLYDVSQVYFHSSETMSRTVYLKPRLEGQNWFEVL